MQLWVRLLSRRSYQSRRGRERILIAVALGLLKVVEVLGGPLDQGNRVSSATDSRVDLREEFFQRRGRAERRGDGGWGQYAVGRVSLLK